MKKFFVVSMCLVGLSFALTACEHGHKHDNGYSHSSSSSSADRMFESRQRK